MSGWLLAAVLTAFVVGAALQRTSGMGMALVAAPVLSLLLGPVAGVVVANVGVVVSSALVMAQTWAHIDWHRYARLGPMIALGSVPGALVVRSVSLAWLDVVVGASVLLGLLATWAARGAPPVRGSGPALATGLLAGFMNTSAGVAGPPLVVYGLLARWEQRSWAATAAPVFATAGTCSLISKATLGGVRPDQLLSVGVWGLVAAAILAGVALGHRWSERIDPRLSRGVAIGVAAVGAALALGRGLLAL